MLIRNAFAANSIHTGFESFGLRGPTGLIPYRFHSDTVAKYGWDLICLRKVQTITKGKKTYSVEASGIVRDPELLSLFEGAGYADCFFFSSDAVIVKREGMNYSDPIFDPQTATIKIRLSIYYDAMDADLQKLNGALYDYTIMAKLSR